MLFTGFREVQKQEISVFFVKKTFAVQRNVAVIVNLVHMYVVKVIVKQHLSCILCPLFGHTILVRVRYFSFLSCFDIGKVPRSPRNCNYNLFSFLPFIFTFKHACKVQLREYQKDMEYRLHHCYSKFDWSVFLKIEPIS